MTSRPGLTGAIALSVTEGEDRGRGDVVLLQDAPAVLNDARLHELMHGADSTD